jgi:hypothetical protein
MQSSIIAFEGIRLRAILAVLVISNATAANAQEADRIDDKTAQHFNYLMSGVKKGRLLINSGVYRAYGTMLGKGEDGEPDTEGKVEIYCAFDYAKEDLRFDRTQPVLMRDEGEQQWRLLRHKHQYVRTQKNQIIRHPIGGVISIRPLDSVLKSGAHPFDIRVVGLAMHAIMHDTESFESLYKLDAEEPPKSVERIDKDITKITWKRRLREYTKWINETQGFTPIRYEVHRQDKDTGGRKLVYRCEATWQEKSGVWVPKTMRSENTKPVETLEIAFEWESVNSPIPPITFTPEGFDVEKHLAPVVDHTLGKPVLVDLLRPKTAPDVPLPASVNRLWGYALTALASVATVLIASFFMIWRRRR